MISPVPLGPPPVAGATTDATGATAELTTAATELTTAATTGSTEERIAGALVVGGAGAEDVDEMVATDEMDEPEAVDEAEELRVKPLGNLKPSLPVGLC